MIAYNPKDNLAKFKFLINTEPAELVVGTPVAAVSNELVMLLENEA